MTESNNVYDNHAAALRIFIRAGQDLERACEKNGSSHLTTVKQLREELSEVRGELTEDRKTLQDKEVTIAKLEATVRGHEQTIGHVDLLRQYEWMFEKYKVWERDFQKLEEEKHQLRKQLEYQLRKQLDKLEKSEGKRPLSEADNDTAETDPKKARTGGDTCGVHPES